jgi:hypothetical protein
MQTQTSFGSVLNRFEDDATTMRLARDGALRMNHAFSRTGCCDHNGHEYPGYGNREPPRGRHRGPMIGPAIEVTFSRTPPVLDFRRTSNRSTQRTEGLTGKREIAGVRPLNFIGRFLLFEDLECVDDVVVITVLAATKGPADFVTTARPLFM